MAIIPARGGSKRIYRKNIKSFVGEPIISYSIKAALDSKLFDEVMVSTDDSDIAELALSLGATVPFMRSYNNADDFATTFDVIEEVLNEYKKLGKAFDIACCIYATAPFVTAELLGKGLSKLNEGFDTVFPILQYGFPIQRAVRFDDKGKIGMVQPEYLNTRSQDLKRTYHDSGQFYWFKVAKAMSSKKLIGNNTSGIIISEMMAHDIDTLHDWAIAEFKYNLLQEKNV